MTALYDQLKELYLGKLYSNVVSFGDMVLTVSESIGDASMTSIERYRCMAMVGNSYFCLGQMKQAETVLKKAIQLTKNLIKNKVIKTSDLSWEGLTDIDLKCTLAECHISSNQNSQAKSVLETITPKMRTSRVNMLLGNIYQLMGSERSAILAYKEVIKVSPCSLDAAERLVELGVSGSELSNLMRGVSESQPPDWLVTFIKGLAARYSLDMSGSIASFKQLEKNTALGQNNHLLTTLGETYYYNGDSRLALDTLQRAHETEPSSLKSIELLGSLYYTDKRIKDLEVLASKAISITEREPQPWILMGFYSHLSNKKDTTKAIYFAHKACSLHPSSIEGLMLKGSLLRELKKYQEAVIHFREALSSAPQRFEPYEGLVECYLQMHRNIEAISLANDANKVLGQSARSLTLYATVMLRTLEITKAKTYLEKALKEDPYYLPAVFHLVDIYTKEKKLDKAIELVHKQIIVQSGCRLHTKLSELYRLNNQFAEAKLHAGVAKRIASMGDVIDDESGVRLPPGGVMGGALDIEGTASPEVSYGGMETEDINDSEGDAELSDLEAIWSDGDMSFSAQ